MLVFSPLWYAQICNLSFKLDQPSQAFKAKILNNLLPRNAFIFDGLWKRRQKIRLDPNFCQLRTVFASDHVEFCFPQYRVLAREAGHFV